MDILKLVMELRAKREPFVLATVVAYKRPQSAKPGSHAIIRQDGTITGWVGGGCVQPILLREAKKVLEEKKPGLIVISPEQLSGDWQGVREHLMSCQGGGSLQIYLEPMLPRPQLLVFGHSPVAQTLVELGKLLEFDVSSITDPAGVQIPDGSYVVVATMGDGDEESLTAVAGSSAAHVAFVGSKEKSSSLFAYLRGKGIAEAAVSRIKSPAGLPLGAETLPEIAFSVMAEILQIHKGSKHAVDSPGAKKSMPIPVLQSRPEARDPICGMSVDVAKAKHTSVHEGETYYFCCLRCKETFEQSPVQYVRK